MTSALACASALWLAAAAGGEPSAYVGTVRVKGPAQTPTVTIKTDAQELTLRGELTEELARLQAMRVEVLGALGDGELAVREYRIVDIGGGQRPLVGRVVEAGAKVALRDGDADSIVLSINPRGLRELRQNIGAKIWVHGTKLLSGELKVLRYGILRRPPTAEGAPSETVVPSGAPAPPR